MLRRIEVSSLEVEGELMSANSSVQVPIVQEEFRVAMYSSRSHRTPADPVGLIGERKNIEENLVTYHLRARYGGEWWCDGKEYWPKPVAGRPELEHYALDGWLTDLMERVETFAQPPHGAWYSGSEVLDHMQMVYSVTPAEVMLRMQHIASRGKGETGHADVVGKIPVAEHTSNNLIQQAYSSPGMWFDSDGEHYWIVAFEHFRWPVVPWLKEAVREVEMRALREKKTEYTASDVIDVLRVILAREAMIVFKAQQEQSQQ
jgi:hypothetical protein